MASLDDLCKRTMDTNSRKSVDDADRKGVSDAYNAGLETRVIRTYDDVGLHGGKDDCEFCKSREGDWSYKDAIQHGVFQRHPGCGCEIDYVTERGTKRQVDWKHNTWDEDFVDDAVVALRKAIGIPDENFEDNKKRLIQKCGLIPDNSLRKVDQQLLAVCENQLETLNNRFSAIPQGNMVIKYDGKKDGLAGVNRSNSRIFLGKKYSDRNLLIESARRAAISKWHMPSNMDDETLSKYTITHEFGHILQNSIFEKAVRAGYRDSKVQFLEECYNEIITIAKKNNPNFKYEDSISKYGRKNNNRAEFFAECFANSQLGKPNDLGNAIEEWLVQKGY